MARKTGVRNRNYPSMPLEKALVVAQAIQDDASGNSVRKLTLAKLLDTTPASRKFRDLVLASNAYGLTDGGVNGDLFGLTTTGAQATSGSNSARRAAMRAAVMSVLPFRLFLLQFASKKMPAFSVMSEFLVDKAKVPEEWVQSCADQLIQDARLAGMVTEHKGGLYVASRDELENDLNDRDDGDKDQFDEITDTNPIFQAEDVDSIALTEDSADIPTTSQRSNGRLAEQQTARGKKVFVAHGKNRKPLTELKSILDRFGVKYAIAVDEPNAGRPISAKVGQLMREECSSAIFIFTADELFSRIDSDGNIVEVWRPSENVIYELGAASVLYDRRIVIFKEKGVSFPSDFSDLGYISFAENALGTQLGELFSELVALDILEVRAKS